MAYDDSTVLASPDDECAHCTTVADKYINAAALVHQIAISEGAYVWSKVLHDADESKGFEISFDLR